MEESAAADDRQKIRVWRWMAVLMLKRSAKPQGSIAACFRNLFRSGTSSERNFEHCSSSPAANAALEACTHRRSQEDYHPPPSRSGHVSLEGSMVRDHSALILGEHTSELRNELHACTHRRS